MADCQKNQALSQKIKELEKQAAGERQDVATRFENLKRQNEVKTLKERQLQDQELQVLSVNYSYLQRQYKSLLQRHTLLLGAFKNVRSVTFDEYISAEADKVAQDQIEAIREETENKIKALQSKIKELFVESAFSEENKASLSNVISTMLEGIEKLEVRINTLSIDAKKSSIKIQELETARDSLDKALQESTQSLSEKSNELRKLKSQYNTEKKRLEDELFAFRKAKEMLNEKLRKEEKEAKRKEEDEIKRKEEEEKVRSSVQPRSNTPGVEASSAVFTTITCIESTCKYMVKAGRCCCRANALDINKYNVLAVADDYFSVYLYSETNKSEEKLCTYPYGILCLAWNQQGTLLAIGGNHHNNTNMTIQVWDIPNRKITKKLKIRDNNQNCYCLDWKGDTITAGTSQYIYQWNINDRGNDQNTQGNKALLPRKTIQNKYSGSINTVQWSICKSKLAIITYQGNMCIYDEKFKLIHQNKAHEDWNSPLLQSCPWDDQVIATCCDEGHLKIWRVQQDITLIKEVKHESGITNIKWVPSKKAIITAHENNQLVLWEYPSLSIIRTINGHTGTPHYLALNADKSAMVSKSEKEMIFWKPFDQF